MSARPFHFLLAALFYLALVPGSSQAQFSRSQPEAATGREEKSLAVARRQMVAAAHPLAVEAGLAMLDRGGSAVDAAIAAQLVLNLVEPQSSGIGGGAYLLHYDAARRALSAIDGRETAPASTTPELLLDAGGKPMTLAQSAVGGRSVGVPGVLRLTEAAHTRYGKLPWPTLFEPAIRLAEQGYPLTARVAQLADADRALRTVPAARALYFTDDGKVKAVGSKLRNPALAALLRRVAREGPDAFYHGAVADDIVQAVNTAKPLAGTLTREDLANYRVRTLDALCGTYRAFRVCGMPPSSSGGIAVLQVLQTLQRFDLPSMRPMSAEAVHLISEASRLAYADRGRYVADDRFYPVPIAGLVDPAYNRQRGELIRPERSMRVAEPGTPPGVVLAASPQTDDLEHGTSHLSVIDRWGNAVAMTSSIEQVWGSRQMVHGFLLNNQLTDFNAAPVEKGLPVANAPAAGKRPRSSMSPTLVFDGDGNLVMTLGSPGGSQIINYVVKTLVATLDWNMDIQSAIALPNFGSRNGPTELEKNTSVTTLDGALKALGHDVRAVDMTSGLHGIRRTKDGLQGGADPRREGLARGR
jgi:gamma-glutamyltranspeptidase/glutathione hydrolase